MFLADRSGTVIIDLFFFCFLDTLGFRVALVLFLDYIIYTGSRIAIGCTVGSFIYILLCLLTFIIITIITTVLYLFFIYLTAKSLSTVTCIQSVRV